MGHHTYASGGAIRSTVTVLVSSRECIIGTDGRCRRNDAPHASATLPPKDERFWVCPMHDGESV
jgi:hypothetical protein